jgi:hypothetical protein
MLPKPEISALITAVEGATTFAAAGRLAEGYTLLLTGFRRAARIRDAGQSWAVQLVWRYELALDNYTDAYRVPLKCPPASLRLAASPSESGRTAHRAPRCLPCRAFIGRATESASPVRDLLKQPVRLAAPRDPEEAPLAMQPPAMEHKAVVSNVTHLL